MVRSVVSELQTFVTYCTCMVWYVTMFSMHIQTAYQGTVSIPSQKVCTVQAYHTFQQKFRGTVLPSLVLC